MEHVIQKKISNFREKYNGKLVILSAKFSGLNCIKFKDISIIPDYDSRDTVLNVKAVQANISILSLLIGNVHLGDLKVDGIKFNIIQRDSISNYQSLFKKKANNNDSLLTHGNYGEKINKILDAIFDKIPSGISLHDMNVSFTKKSYTIFSHISDFKVIDKKFNTNISIVENDSLSHWIVKGVLDPGDRVINIKLYSAGKNKICFPFLKFKWNMLFSFDTLQFNLNEINYRRDILNLGGQASFSGIIINHEKIASNNVYFNKGTFNYSLNIGDDYFEVDSTSKINLNKISFNPYIKYRVKPARQFTFKINKDYFNSQDFFESLPEGLFSNLKGIKTTGKLAYHLNFYVDLNQPDGLIFSSSLDKKDFKIVEMGETDITKINHPFSYTAYDKDVAIETFTVGPENPQFVSFDQIPATVKNAVLFSEDGEFFYHKGFIEESFRMSIAKNIKEKRFARGGSTITMQLVKNVFLRKNKTIMRKLEEALIVWLIENNHLSSKERMFEVYLNIIEWGPRIYGIYEASFYYFNKCPSQLTLAESIFLACIIPQPKCFRYYFDKNGNLKDFLADYYRVISTKMYKRDLISEDDYNNLEPNVILKGRAKSEIINKTDSIPEEPLNVEMF
ncbi:MAG: biosynthetic peptidoglycan transglycosylase [Bacteroidota bacterium]|nr:biosynthetic peptidoglycan transglycosylase [Bacteroidota bacterium]